MAEFIYNNVKNASTAQTPFELNCGLYPQVSFKDNFNPCSKSCFTNKLAKKLRELMDICQQNLFHTHDLQKRANDKNVKP